MSQRKVFHHSYCDQHYNEVKFGKQERKPVEEPPMKRRLKKLGFRVKTVNGGKQYILKKKSHIVDFWLASEKFTIRNTGQSGQGVWDLAKKLEAA